MKKLNLTLLLTTLLSMVGTRALAHDIEVANADGVTIYYTWANNKTELTVSFRGSSWSSYSNEYSGNVVIPESVTYNATTFPVTTIENKAFYQCSGLTSVTIPNSVTSISGSAFYGCSGLTSFIVVSDNTKYDSRDNCNAIIETALNTMVVGCKNTIIPNSVTSIGKEAFSGCSDLTIVTIPNSVTSIGNGAFSGCSGLMSVTIPNSVTSIGNYAFSGCSSLTSVTIGNSVTSIGEWAFTGCSGLTSVTIGNSVTSIGHYAFEGCSGLTSVTIPNSVMTIGYCAFSGCSGLTRVTIGNSVTSISGSAFSGCSNLTSVTIPNSVTDIGLFAFRDCSSLTSVTIGNSVTSIGERAFINCSGLTSVTIGNSVTSIGSGAFEGCSGLTSVTIPNSVTSIGHYAFHGCSGLKSVTIPNSVTTIENKAFSDCTGLTSVICQSTIPPTLGDGGFSDYTIPLYVPKGSVLKYKAADNWRNFVIIREISEEQDVYLSVRQVNGMVRMKVDAEKPYFNLQIKADEGWMIHSVTLNENDVTAEVSEDGYYTTSVISSDAVLNIVFEKGGSGIAVQSESPLRILAYGNTIQVSGAETGEQIVVYSVDGKLVERVKAEHGTATITLPENQTYIVKGRTKTVKVRL